MILTYDQQKNLRRLIDNAGAGTYEEVRNELYDHLVQAVESRMERKGVPFTEAQQEALEEMGGASGLLSIEQGYIEAAKKQSWLLFRAFVPIYLASFRWLIPILLGILFKYFIPTKMYFYAGTILFIAFLVIAYQTLKKWSYGTAEQGFDGHPVSLRAFVIAERGKFFCMGLVLANMILTPKETLGPIATATLFLTFTLADFGLAFVLHARKTWLEVA